MEQRDQPAIVITGGGTAGHVFPALTIADALVDAGYRAAQISFVGSRRGIERTAVPERGYAIVLLGGRGIMRKITPANAVAVAGLAMAFVHALTYLARLRPRVVVSVGGYASVPSAFAAACLRIPIVVVNVDAVAGLANRLVSRLARVSAVAFEGTGLDRSVVTGAPVRATIEHISRDDETRLAARRMLAVREDGLLIAVIGGSLGARRLNEYAIALARAYRARADLSIYHVVGPRNVAEMDATSLSDALGSNYTRIAFCDDMASMLAAVDLVVCRSGAMTVAELAVAGVPSILVPLPTAPHDHQRKNAEALARHGAAIIVDETRENAETLVSRVTQLLDDAEARAAMAAAARGLGRKNAAQAIARIVDNVVHRRPQGFTPSEDR